MPVSTTSRWPCATRRTISSSTASARRLREAPRTSGMTQKLHENEQPSWTFTNARTRSSRASAWTQPIAPTSPSFVAGDVGAIGCVQADARLDRVRAFVKVQDGCSFSCNFCVIPLVRGASRSRRADAVLDEIVRRVAQGHREVVLTGINLGCYRDREAAYDLPRLVREAGATSGLSRLRLSSIEVNHLTAELADALRETPTVCRHLHVPLQSGDDGVLHAMARRYDSA